METKDCNCPYCVKCECGHTASDHRASNGACMQCECKKHSNPPPLPMYIGVSPEYANGVMFLYSTN